MSNQSHLNPKLHEGTYVFTSVPIDTDINSLTVVASIHEAEGLTVVLPEQQAIQQGFPIQFRCSWITLGMESTLESVGLTAAFARALADKSIPCNVVAGTYHDHLFVPLDRADDALQCLRELQTDDNE
ncbi:MAG: ACT domain-containing protein [Verrucomicrobiota bacterium]|nr:ACT domain-containing protein [Verrucomicrobiota bacterium]